MDVTFENKGSRYLFDFKEYQLRCEVSRVHASHDKAICKLLVTTYHPDYNPHLLGDNFNLTSSRSRSTLAKDLATRYHPKGLTIDWKNVLEYVSQKAVTEFERGEPVLEITSEDQVGELEYLIYPIAPVGKPTFIFGEPGSGKSQLCGLFNMVMLLPWTENPLHLTISDKPIRCIFLDYEADVEDMRRLLKSFVAGMGLPQVNMYYRRCDQPIAKDVESIRAYIDELGAECLLIDSASMAAGGDLNRMEVAQEYIRALRQLKITSISLAHTSKDRESKNKTILGSVLFEAGARSVWECRGQEDEDHNAFDIALFHRKSNLSKKSKPLGYRITYNEEGNTIEWLDPKSVPEFMERMSTNQRVLDALKKGKLSSQELIGQLDVKPNTVTVALKRLLKAQRITGDSKGWGLLEL